MADPLSVIASIVGVGVASAQLANKVYDFTDKYRNAPAQMQDVASEMSHLSSIFSLLASVLSNGQGLYKPQVLQDATSIIGRVNKIQDEIKKLMRRNSGIRARMKWVMSFGKVSELLDRIEALKSSLGILLDTTQLALTTREPRLNFDEIERLKNLITAGVKEIRQCVITLQTAKPALMFEPPKLLDAAPVSETGLVVPRTYHSLPIMTLPSSRKHPRNAAKNTVDAMEPSGAQFETASWLYNMTLARSGSYVDSAPHFPGPSLPNPFNPQPGDGAFRDAGPPTPYHSAVPDPQVTRVPPPQRLYEIPVSAVAHNLVGTWTYLNPSEFFATRDAILEEQPDASYDDSGSDDDDNVPSPLHGPSRRTFTFEEYHRALETGSIYDSSFKPQSSSRKPPMRKAGNDDQQNRAMKRREGERITIRNHEDVTESTYDDDISDGSDKWIPRDEKIFTTTRRAPPPPPPPPPPPDTAKEDAILEKLNYILLGKAEQDAKEEAEARNAAELAKFDRLEALLTAQQEAALAKEKARKEAAEEAAQAAARAKKEADETSLAKLEKLILQQKDEHIKREAAAEAARRAKEEEAAALKHEFEQEKKAAAEAAALLIQAAKAAREEAEKKAAITNKAYEEALTIARQANEETERELRQERTLRQKAQDFHRSPPLLQVLYHSTDEETVVSPRLRAAVSHLVDMMHGKEDKKWYATVNGPSLIDISDGYFARKILDVDDDKLVPNRLCQKDNIPEPAALLHELTTPERYHLVFPIGAQQALEGRKDLVVALQDENIEVLFEMNPNKDKSTMLQLEHALEGTSTTSQRPVRTEYDRGRGDVFIHSSLLWQNLPKDGQSELYRSLCKTDWKPTYLRSSVSGQTWFYGERPIHVRFNRPDYIPCFADFDMDKTHSCIIIGNDIVDKNALELTGIEYELHDIGYWMLDATLTYDDIEGLVAMSFALRETGLRRTVRRAMNPDSSSIRTLGRFGRAAISPIPSFPALSTISEGSETYQLSVAATESSDEYESADSS